MLARHPLAVSVGLLGLGAGLLWAAGWLDPDGARLGRIADAIEDALDVSDLFEDEIMPPP